MLEQITGPTDIWHVQPVMLQFTVRWFNKNWLKGKLTTIPETV